MTKKTKWYFSVGEIALWVLSVAMIIVAYCVFGGNGVLTLIASLIGVTSILINAKGNPIGQCLMIVFSVFYGIISYEFKYYGEMATYLGMSMPMAVFSLIVWLKNPFKGKRSEVKIGVLTKRDVLIMCLSAVVVTVAFYFVLDYFGTANMIPSTISVTTSYVAVYLTFKRSPYFNFAYALNDVVLIILWSLASVADKKYISVTVCFGAFFINDVYGFISWLKRLRTQSETSENGGRSESLCESPTKEKEESGEKVQGKDEFGGSGKE